MCRLLVFIVSLVSVVGCFAQQGVEWLETSYDFGTINEIDGSKSGRVRFVNHGPEETVINRVTSSCGCTSVSYPHDIIAVGDTAVIGFTYNPIGRPGRINKSLQVFFGVENNMKLIKLNGMVIGKTESLAHKYPVEFGLMRLSTSSLILGDVMKGESRHEFIGGYNQSERPMNLRWENLPDCFSLGVSNSAIVPGDIVTISVYYNSRDDDNYGLSEHAFDLVADDGVNEYRQKIVVTVNLKVDTSKFTTEEIQNSPRIVVSDKVIDLGKVSSDEKLRRKFSLRNEGKSVLEVKRIYSLNKAFVLRRVPSKVKVGKSEKVDYEFDLSKIPEGAFNVKIEVVSNDPLRPAETIRIVGEKVSSNKK